MSRISSWIGVFCKLLLTGMQILFKGFLDVLLVFLGDFLNANIFLEDRYEKTPLEIGDLGDKESADNT